MSIQINNHLPEVPTHEEGMHQRHHINVSSSLSSNDTTTSRNGSFDVASSTAPPPLPASSTIKMTSSCEEIIDQQQHHQQQPDEIDENQTQDSPSYYEPFCWCESLLPSPCQSFIKENAAFLSLALPSIVIQFVRNIIAAIPFAFAGRLLDKMHLGGYILGFSFANGIGVAVGMGISSVLDTLATQSRGYHGARSTVIGVHLRTTYFFAILYSILFFLVCFFFGEAAVQLLRPDLTKSASAFLLPSVSVVFGTTFVSSTHKFLNAQHKTPIALYGYILGSMLALAISFWIYSAKDGDFFRGEDQQLKLISALCWAIGIGRFSSGVFMFLIAMRDPDVYFCWTGKNLQEHNTIASSSVSHHHQNLWLEAVQYSNIVSFLSLCGHSIISACADRWSMEILTVMLAGAGKYSEVDLDAFGTLTTIWIFSFPLSVGCYVAASCLCGNALGRGAGDEAHRVALKTLRWGVTSCTIFCIIYSLFPHLLSNLLVSNDTINRKISQVAPIFAFGALGDSIQFIFQGIFRSAGRISLVSKSSVICQWIVAVPLASILVLKFDYGLVGLGIAMLVGNISQCCAFVVSFRMVEWEELAKNIKDEHDAKNHRQKQMMVVGSNKEENEDEEELRKLQTAGDDE